MVRSMFSGISGLRAHQEKMDVIANNIANVNTYGYKSGRVTFKESIYQTISASSDGNDIYGGSNPSQIGYGSQIGTIDLMFSSGAYAPTDSTTDCMIDGQGFFILGSKGSKIEIKDDDMDATSAEMSKTLLSRVGNFVFDGEGYLVDGNGNVAYGYADPKDTSYISPIRISYVDENGDVVGYDEDGASPMTLSNITISSTGEIIGTDNNGNNVTVGMLAIANVPNANALEKTQGPYYTTRSNTGYITPYPPGEGTTGTIISNGLELSNVDLAKEFSEMITTQRGFQANTKIITVTDEMLEELVNMKR